MLSHLRLPVVLPGLVVALACATHANAQGTVIERELSRPPYYAGKSGTELAARSVRLGHLPVAYQRGAEQAPIFDPRHSEELQSLLDEMTAYLDSLGVSLRLVEGGRASAVTHGATSRPPDVQFSCVESEPDSEECVSEPGAAGRGRLPMRLAVARPSKEWVAWMSEVMNQADVTGALVLTLEVGRYPLRQVGFKGDKVVELGAGHTARFPWLTSLEQPVLVLQLTGALMTPEGKAVRIGAEGLLARRTSLTLSAIGAQHLVTDEEVRSLRSARRNDIPGKPLVWQAGLRSMVASLTGRRDLTPD